MLTKKDIDGSVLPLILVIVTLMATVTLGVLFLYDIDFQLFSRLNHSRAQRDNIESAFRLYRNDPNIIASLEADSSLLLYDTLPSSRMKISHRDWGLYEIVSVSSSLGTVSQSRIMGLCRPAAQECALWYRNNKSALTLTGNTNIIGHAYLPQNGTIYGQMQSVFFSGKKLSPTQVKKSEESLPTPLPGKTKAIKGFFDLPATTPFCDSLAWFFYGGSPSVIRLGSGNLAGCSYAGNIILQGDELHIDRTTSLSDVIIAARKVTIGEGFKGSAQIFALDSVIVQEAVELKAPSGIYAGSFAELGENTLLEGYLIVDFDGKPDRRKPNCRKARTSRLRGLVYTRGVTQLQGTVVGTTYLDKATYYSPHGYYEDMLFDASLIGGQDVAYPVWMSDKGKRKEVKCVR